VLLTYRGSTDWKDTKSAIALHLGRMCEVWSKGGPEANATDMCFMAGISFALASVFFLTAFFPGIASPVLPSFMSFVAPIPLCIGWFAASAGLMAVLKQGVMLFGLRLPGWIYGVGGVLSIFVCVPLMRAMAGFEKHAKGDSG
jgi:hypothetical protein